ncbi:hypothetical protein AAVH_27733 [Aphelenchoides avenae]|nr:hypothetical protein AAVH_27733 [Aphelenchus avenae]
MQTATTLIALAVMACLCVPAAGTLSCYKAYASGKLGRGGVASGCKDPDSGCAKQVYDNSTVWYGCDHLCEADKNGIQPYELRLTKEKSTLYCCYTDKCNGAASFVLAPTMLFVVASLFV